MASSEDFDGYNIHAFVQAVGSLWVIDQAERATLKEDITFLSDMFYISEENVLEIFNENSSHTALTMWIYMFYSFVSQSHDEGQVEDREEFNTLVTNDMHITATAVETLISYLGMKFDIVKLSEDLRRHAIQWLGYGKEKYELDISADTLVGVWRNYVFQYLVDKHDVGVDMLTLEQQTLYTQIFEMRILTSQAIGLNRFMRFVAEVNHVDIYASHKVVRAYAKCLKYLDENGRDRFVYMVDAINNRSDFDIRLNYKSIFDSWTNYRETITKIVRFIMVPQTPHVSWYKMCLNYKSEHPGLVIPLSFILQRSLDGIAYLNPMELDHVVDFYQSLITVVMSEADTAILARCFENIKLYYNADAEGDHYYHLRALRTLQNLLVKYGIGEPVDDLFGVEPHPKIQTIISTIENQLEIVFARNMRTFRGMGQLGDAERRIAFNLILKQEERFNSIASQYDTGGRNWIMTRAKALYKSMGDAYNTGDLDALEVLNFKEIELLDVLDMHDVSVVYDPAYKSPYIASYYSSITKSIEALKVGESITTSPLYLIERTERGIVYTDRSSKEVVSFDIERDSQTATVSSYAISMIASFISSNLIPSAMALPRYDSLPAYGE